MSRKNIDYWDGQGSNAWCRHFPGQAEYETRLGLEFKYRQRL